MHVVVASWISCHVFLRLQHSLKCHRNHCTCLQCICQGRALSCWLQRAPLLFLPGPMVVCVKHAIMGRNVLPPCMTCLRICPECHSQVNCFCSTSLEAALHLKPVPSDRALPALKPQTDVMLNVSAGFSVSGAVGFMWSHCAVICLNKSCTMKTKLSCLCRG